MQKIQVILYIHSLCTVKDLWKCGNCTHAQRKPNNAKHADHQPQLTREMETQQRFKKIKVFNLDIN